MDFEINGQVVRGLVLHLLEESLVVLHMTKLQAFPQFPRNWETTYVIKTGHSGIPGLQSSNQNIFTFSILPSSAATPKAFISNKYPKLYISQDLKLKTLKDKA